MRDRAARECRHASNLIPLRGSARVAPPGFGLLANKHSLNPPSCQDHSEWQIESLDIQSQLPRAFLTTAESARAMPLRPYPLAPAPLRDPQCPSPRANLLPQRTPAPLLARLKSIAAPRPKSTEARFL